MEPQRESQPTPVAASPQGTVETVVLFADMVSYSRHIGLDEATTLEFMSSCFDTLRILARRYTGTLIKTLGDGAMLLFDDPQDAINYAVEFQRIVAKMQLDASDPYAFRVGLHQGHVLIRDGDAYGNTVNVAARLQTVAAPGQCVVSQIVYDATRTTTEIQFEALGAPALKNISNRIPAYRLVDPLLETRARVSATEPQIEVLKGATVPNVPDLGIDSRLLLGYLALCPGRADSLERLAELFGAEDGESRVAASIANLASGAAQGSLPITQYDGMLTLDPVVVETDLDALLREVRRGRVPELLTTDAYWPERILSGLDGAGTVFSGWRKVTRATWKRRILQALEILLERSTPKEDSHEHAADAILLLEPGNEVAAEARIAARIARGDRSGALSEFERLEHYLAQTHGISPGERIQAAIQSFVEKGERSAKNIVSPAPSRPRRLLRIAVANFVDSAGETPERLSAFRDDLIANLIRFRDWSVIDGVEGKEDQLDVDYRIDGTSMRKGVISTYALKLSDNTSGRIIWAERFDHSAKVWEQTQREVIRQIAALIEGYVSADRLASALGNKDHNPTSHDAWLRGDRAMMRWTPEGVKEAQAIFEGILEKDPDHTASLFRLASISNVQHVIWPGRERRTADDAVADRFASRAVDLDPMDERVQRTVAWTAAMNGAFARATMHMDLAANLNPNSPTTLASCAMGFSWFGEHEKADAALTRCLSISRMLPQWGWAYIASTYFILGRMDEAMEAAELGGDSIADTQGWIAAIHVCRGEEKEAGAAFRMFVDNVTPRWSGPEPVTPDSAANWFANAYPLRRASDRARLANAILRARRAAWDVLT